MPLKPDGPLIPKCRKKKYKDRIAALHVLAKIQHKDGSKRPVVERRAYHCALCNRWHLTHELKNGEREDGLD